MRERERERVSEVVWAREEESKSGWRLWIADVALWGLGRGHASLNPALAGWHRGEREVTAPQHTAHKTLRIVGKGRKRICLKYTLTSAVGGEWLTLWVQSQTTWLR